MLQEIQEYSKCLDQVGCCTEWLASPHRRIHLGPKIFLVKSCVLLQTTSFHLKYSEEYLPIGHELAMRPEMSIINWVFLDYQAIRLAMHSRNPEYGKLHWQMAQTP